MNEIPKDLELVDIKSDINALKSSVGLLCDWIFKKFDIQLLDKALLIGKTEGAKGTPELRKDEATQTYNFSTPKEKHDDFHLVSGFMDKQLDIGVDIPEFLGHSSSDHIGPNEGIALSLQNPDGTTSNDGLQQSTSMSNDCDETKRSKKAPKKSKSRSKPSKKSQKTSGFQTEAIQCEICGKILNGPRAMKRHTQTHNNIRPHSCQTCGKAFQRRFHLKTHCLIHLAEKKYQCRFCGRLFLLPKDLVCHERVHTGEKPFACTHCSRRFNLKSHLTMHIRVHTGDKPYRCDACDKCFSQANSLRVHRRKTHSSNIANIVGGSTETESNNHFNQSNPLHPQPEEIRKQSTLIAILDPVQNCIEVTAEQLGLPGVGYVNTSSTF